MGGLYISPNSNDMSWKRRGLRVSSEALLCLGVATIVASFVVDVNPDGSKPNIWILIGGVIMLMAAAIGWSLTFCLVFESVVNQNPGSSRNPKAPVHSIQVVVPEAEAHGKSQASKYDPTTYESYIHSSTGYGTETTTYVTKTSKTSPSRTTGTTDPTSQTNTSLGNGRRAKKQDKKPRREKKHNTRTTATSSSNYYSNSSSGTGSTQYSSDSRSYTPTEETTITTSSGERKSYV